MPLLEVGSRDWAVALRDAANRHPLLRELASGFSATIGLKFAEDAAHPARRVLVDIEQGVVTSCEPADEAHFEEADVRLQATCQAWEQVLGGLTEPLRAVVLRRVQVDGDKLLLVKGLPSVKALIEAAKELDASFAHN